MISLTENDQIYVAYLCSTVPNNECDICSHYLPDYVLQTTPIRHPWAFGYHGHDKCYSCKRPVTRVFVSSKMPVPKRVPSEFPFRFPEDVLVGHFKFEEIKDWSRAQRFQFIMDTKPLVMRPDLDWEERNRKIAEYLEATTSGDSRKIQRVSFEELNVVPVEAGKAVKRKLRFK